MDDNRTHTGVLAARLGEEASISSITERGFTFVELAIALAIGSIVVAFALPSFQTLMGSSQIRATTNTLVHSLQTARSEAIKRSRPVGLCTSALPLDMNATCTPGGDYQKGWIVYVDEDGNGTRDGSDELILQIEARSEAFAFAPDAAFASQVYFNDAGASSNAVNIPLSGQIGIDYANGTDERLVTVSANGRISSEVP